MKVIAIVCANYNKAIGFQNKLLYEIPSEREIFTKYTLKSPDKKKNVLIMGRKTFQSISNVPLPKRHNCVVSSQAKKLKLKYAETRNLDFFSTIPLCLEFIKKNTSRFHNSYICGGVSLYKYFIDNSLLDYIYYTEIIHPKNNFGDIFFPYTVTELKNYEIIRLKRFRDKSATNNLTSKRQKVDFNLLYFKHLHYEEINS